jgi:hypothetical protein
MRPNGKQATEAHHSRDGMVCVVGKGKDQQTWVVKCADGGKWQIVITATSFSSETYRRTARCLPLLVRLERGAINWLMINTTSKSGDTAAQSRRWRKVMILPSCQPSSHRTYTFRRGRHIPCCLRCFEMMLALTVEKLNTYQLEL